MFNICETFKMDTALAITKQAIKCVDQMWSFVELVLKFVWNLSLFPFYHRYYGYAEDITSIHEMLFGVDDDNDLSLENIYNPECTVTIATISQE